MKKILVISPHPDDESLGCGGTLLKHKLDGDEINWLIATSIEKSDDYSDKSKKIQKNSIDKVKKAYDFKDVIQLDFNPSFLDFLPRKKIIDKISDFINKVKPNILYLPFPYDAHGDHYEVFKASITCTKSFRYPFVEKVRVYETLSETEFNLNIQNSNFKPNLYIDISQQLNKKIEIIKLYTGEIKDHPFPRSEDSIKALATLRGAVAGCNYAESFISIKEVL